MNGITILEEYATTGFSKAETIAMGCSVGIVAIGVIVFACLLRRKQADTIPASAITSAAAIVCLLACAFYAVLFENIRNPHTEYVIRIDDSAGFNQVTQRYEIIRQNEDSTYVVRERPTE